MNLRLAMTMPMPKAAELQRNRLGYRACLHNTVDELHDVGQDLGDF
jgi:hypothetical protein